MELKDYQNECVRDELPWNKSEEVILRRAYSDLDCVNDLVKRHLREWHTIINKLIELGLESKESVQEYLDMWSSAYEEMTKAQHAEAELNYKKWQEGQRSIEAEEEESKVSSENWDESFDDFDSSEWAGHMAPHIE